MMCFEYNILREMSWIVLIHSFTPRMCVCILCCNFLVCECTSFYSVSLPPRPPHFYGWFFFFKWFQIYSSDYWCSNPVRIITMGCVLVSFMEFGGVGFATNRANPCNKLENLARSHVFYKFSFCRKCRFFRNPNSCPVVQAFINPRTLCRTLIYLFNQSCNNFFFSYFGSPKRGKIL